MQQVSNGVLRVGHLVSEIIEGAGQLFTLLAHACHRGAKLGQDRLNQRPFRNLLPGDHRLRSIKPLLRPPECRSKTTPTPRGRMQSRHIPVRPQITDKQLHNPPQHRRGRACTQRPRWTRSRKLLRIVRRRQNTTATAQRGRRFSPGIIRRGQLNLGAVITASVDHRRGSLQQRLRRILIRQPKHVTSRILTSIGPKTSRQRTQRGHQILTNSSHRTARGEHHIRVDRQRSHARNFALWRAVSPFTESSLGSSDVCVTHATRTRRAVVLGGRYVLADSNSISSIDERRAEPR
ncbi:hypothetical protein LAUMK4_02993 [Mycobacterium persicum]|uniref:Uncharacterized protein n=1 Tax=Mycobacterium persicum TaxID=1487726 RepID=A0ABY6RJQ7_9MYCO|nr:hypothetical protein LAUMK15_03319 [Mycobacterium persicum]VAZ94974.1 hypothetical protein LAUMK4_02993 [Mycobacterium persicum]